MKALILANQSEEAAQPLTSRTPVAMLPLLGKPLLVHVVESLVGAGITDIVVATRGHTELIERTLGRGRALGASIEYLRTRQEDDLSTAQGVSERASEHLGTTFLAVRADIVRSAFLGRFLALAAARPDVTVSARAGGVTAGLWRVCAEAQSGVTVDVPDAVALPVDGLASYAHAVREALHGRVPGLVPDVVEEDARRLLASGADVPPEAVLGRVAAGRGARVSSHARLAGDVVLGDGCEVGSGARLTDVLVLPHTRVGRDVVLRDAVVWGEWLLPLGDGAGDEVVRLSDLSDELPSRRWQRGVDRLLGALLLVLSLPLWPVMLLHSLAVDREQPLRRRRLRGNRVWHDGQGRATRCAFEALEAASPVPLLRHLPRLLAVLTGDLALVGVRPRDLDETRGDDASWVLARAPSGLLTPEVPPGAARDVAERLYAEARTWGGDLLHALRSAGRLADPALWRVSLPLAPSSAAGQVEEPGESP